MDGLTVEMVDTTDTILEEIGHPEMTPRCVAMSCVLADQSPDPTDWVRVFRAILARWGMATLVWIKRAAATQACFEDGCEEGPENAECNSAIPGGKE